MSVQCVNSANLAQVVIALRKHLLHLIPPTESVEGLIIAYSKFGSTSV